MLGHPTALLVTAHTAVPCPVTQHTSHGRGWEKHRCHRAQLLSATRGGNMDLETNRSLEGELRFSDLILNMLSEGPRDVYFQESGTTRPFSSKEHWNLYRTQSAWGDKDSSCGKHEVPFLLGGWEGRLMRSNTALMQVVHYFLSGNHPTINNFVKKYDHVPMGKWHGETRWSQVLPALGPSW